MRQNHFLQLVANPACIMANIYIAIAFAFLSFVAIWLHAGFISFVALIIVVCLTTVLAIFGMAIQVTMLVLSAGREKADSQLEVWEYEERVQLEIRLAEQTHVKMLEKGYTSPPLSSLPPLKKLTERVDKPSPGRAVDTPGQRGQSRGQHEDEDDGQVFEADKQIDADMRKVLFYQQKYPGASVRETGDAVGLSKSRAAEIIKLLKDEGSLPR